MGTSEVNAMEYHVIHISFTQRGRICQYTQPIGGVMVGGRGQMAEFWLTFVTNSKKRAGENSESIFSQDVFQILIPLTILSSLK